MNFILHLTCNIFCVKKKKAEKMQMVIDHARTCRDDTQRNEDKLEFNSFFLPPLRYLIYQRSTFFLFFLKADFEAINVPERSLL
jgi:hypothetical protein